MTDDLLLNKKPRGFQTLTPERRREIAIRGGKAAHARGVAHQWTSAEASAAGRLGGIARARKQGRLADGNSA
jgi:general stress protein YciG